MSLEQEIAELQKRKEALEAALRDLDQLASRIAALPAEDRAAKEQEAAGLRVDAQGALKQAEERLTALLIAKEVADRTLGEQGLEHSRQLTEAEARVREQQQAQVQEVGADRYLAASAEFKREVQHESGMVHQAPVNQLDPALGLALTAVAGIEAIKAGIEKLELNQEKRIEQAIAQHQPSGQSQRENEAFAAIEKEQAESVAQKEQASAARKELEQNLQKLEQNFEQRHQNTEPERRDELRQQLQARFQDLRDQLEAKLAEDRQRLLEEQERKRKEWDPRTL